MTDEMLELARANPAKAGVDERRIGSRATSRTIPLPDDTVDVVLSNCVINLSTDKPQVLREAARVLKPGGRFAVSDVIADTDMDDATRADIAAVRRLHRRRAHRATSSRAALADAGLDRHRDHRDPPRPRARRLGDHPRPQARPALGRGGGLTAPRSGSAGPGYPRSRIVPRARKNSAAPIRRTTEAWRP